MPRSVKKGPYLEPYLVKKIAAAQKETNPNKRVIKTWSRRSTILPTMPNNVVAVRARKPIAEAAREFVT